MPAGDAGEQNMSSSQNPSIESIISRLASTGATGLYRKDFLLTWEKSQADLEALFLCADALKALRDANISSRVFDSGLAISQFRDNSTRTRFSYASAANLLGLEVQDLDEGKSQIAHGETVRETANMISFLADAIGIRDDMYIGRGNAYMREVARALDEGFADGVLPRRPAIVNLQCDIDHPTQTMSDALHLRHELGELKGKKLAMTWAYSPSYGKPLSVPQGVAGLMTRFGMDVVLAHPPGYEIMPEVAQRAARQAEASGGSFRISNSMDEAFEGAHVVYPKSWAPFAAMEERTKLFGEGDMEGIKALEGRLLEQNKEHTDWECDEAKMAKTEDALYLHCLPADITGVSCSQGEVSASVFDKFRVPLYRQAGYKPYIIAAMLFTSLFEDPAGKLRDLLENPAARMR
jgi:knotted carbamoyltransferase YgeW